MTIFKILLLPLLLLIGLNLYALEEAQDRIFNVPVREVSIIVTEHGYYPSNLPIFIGEKLKIYLTSTTERPSCLLFPQKDLFMGAEKGKITVGEAYFDRKGEYEFFCPNGKIKGKVKVLERPDKSRRKRALATFRKKKRKKIHYWIPREHYGGLPEQNLDEELKEY